MSELPDLDETADLLRILGHGVRLRLLAALVDGERGVGELEAATRTGQPLLSQQLGVLRRAGLVKTRRAAKQVFYQLDGDRFRQLADLLDRFAATAVTPRAEDIRQRLQRGGSAAVFARIG